MKEIITASELRRDLSSILLRVRRQRESFLIKENGELVATLEPAGVSSTGTWTTLAEVLQDAVEVDAAFANDLEEIQQSQPEMSVDAWIN